MDILRRQKDLDRRPAAPSLSRTAQRALSSAATFFLGFMVLGAIAVRGWDYSNSPAFCANVCHDVHPEEPLAYSDSYHARVLCTECHMGRVSTLQNIVLKLSHVRHIPETLFGQYDRPRESQTLRPASESCGRCHWAPAHQGDHMLEIRRFLPDRDNTEKRTYLVLKVGGGEMDALNSGMGYGIHWHALNKVEYITTDDEHQEIPWVRARMPSGRRVEFNDVANPLSAEEIGSSEIHVMDCVDCHNRVGHPFPPPERTVDDALASGQLNPDLPFAKGEMVALLSANYRNQEEALAAIDAWLDQYLATHPGISDSQASDVEQAAVLAEELLTRLVFRKPGITWHSFHDNGEHRESPGCFRCHDGKHMSSGGESIRLHCNICHSIPVTVDPGDSPAFVPGGALHEPVSHLEASFMADHRFQANDVCVECHGEIAFGSDDSSFCADSACHGEAWPSVDLNATQSHRIPLEGEHAQVWCHECHEGVRTPALQCAGCHEGPDDHLPGECEACHSTAGWVESASSVLVQAPLIRHGLDAREDCLLCHHPEGQTRPAPPDHKDRISGQCPLCHKS